MLRTSENGKPSVSGDVLFNVAHSKGLAVFAFTHNLEVGVDVELLRPLADLEGVVEVTLAPSEAADLQSVSPEDRAAAFFACWTRKEAYLKASGNGLGSPRDVAVTLRPGAPERLVSVQGAPAEPERWELRSSSPGPAMSGPWPSSAPHDATGCDRRHRLPLPGRRELAGGVLAAAPRRRRCHQRGAARAVRHRAASSTPTPRRRARCTRAGAASSTAIDQFDAAFFGFSPREAPHRSAAPAAARDRLGGARGRRAPADRVGGLAHRRVRRASRPTTTATSRCTRRNRQPDRRAIEHRRRHEHRRQPHLVHASTCAVRA